MSARELHIVKASDLTELTSATPDASPERVANSKIWASEDRTDSILPMTSYSKKYYHLVAKLKPCVSKVRMSLLATYSPTLLSPVEETLDLTLYQVEETPGGHCSSLIENISGRST